MEETAERNFSEGFLGNFLTDVFRVFLGDFLRIFLEGLLKKGAFLGSFLGKFFGNCLKKKEEFFWQLFGGNFKKFI